MSRVVTEETDEHSDSGDSDQEPDVRTVALVGIAPDGTTRRAWTFTGSEGSFPSWAWR